MAGNIAGKRFPAGEKKEGKMREEEGNPREGREAWRRK